MERPPLLMFTLDLQEGILTINFNALALLNASTELEVKKRVKKLCTS